MGNSIGTLYSPGDARPPPIHDAFSGSAGDRSPASARALAKADTNKLSYSEPSFRRLRSLQYVYVDKTELIYELAQGQRRYFLSRPCCFGKSLLLSTLAAYFQGEKKLFKGLAIRHLESRWTKYPVLHFNFSVLSSGSIEEFKNALLGKLHEYALQYQVSRQRAGVGECFTHLLQDIHAKKGLGCVVLVDEYDAPLLDHIGDAALSQSIAAVLQTFFRVLKTESDHTRFVLVTGVVRVNGVDLLRDAGDMVDLSARPEYATLCGFTRQELEQNYAPYIAALAARKGLYVNAFLDEMEDEYGAYRFSAGAPTVFCPASVNSAFHDMEFGRYWHAGSAAAFVFRRLSALSYALNDFTRDVTVSREDLAAPFDSTRSAACVLCQAGYLTIQNCDDRTCTLAFPNRDAKHACFEALTHACLRRCRGDRLMDLENLRAALIYGHVNTFFASVKTVYASMGPPPVDTPEALECDFQNAIYAVLISLGRPVSECSCAPGCVSCVTPTGSMTWVIEFKRDVPAASTMEQMREKRYLLSQLVNSDAILVAVSFSSQQRNVVGCVAAKVGMGGAVGENFVIEDDTGVIGVDPAQPDAPAQTPDSSRPPTRRSRPASRRGRRGGRSRSRSETTSA